MLKSLAIVFAAAGFALAVGAWIYQHNSSEKPSSAGAFVIENRCSHLNVVVRSPAPADALAACEGARDAIVFLESNGLRVTGEIAISLSAKLPTAVSSSAAGCYLESERKVLILVYPEFRKLKTWFGIPIDRSLYRSLVSHEVAHLVADHNFKVSKPSIKAKEYIAYVTQFSTMEPALRRRVLLQFPCDGFEGDWQMGATIYMFDCMKFGVRAYRHFLKMANGRDYLHAVLNGEVLLE